MSSNVDGSVRVAIIGEDLDEATLTPAHQHARCSIQDRVCREVAASWRRLASRRRYVIDRRIFLRGPGQNANVVSRRLRILQVLRRIDDH